MSVRRIELAFYDGWCRGNGMAIHVKTSDPDKLLSAYKKAIDDGHVKTWSYDSDGDFTHTADQWIRKGWLRPRIVPGSELVFYTVTPASSEMSSTVYAVYHGRFIESLLRHCDRLFTSAYASAMPEDEDHVG